MLGITALTLAAALAVSFLNAPVYASTAKVLVKPTTPNPLGSVPGPSTIVMETEVEVVRSVPVAELAAKQTAEQPAALLSNVSVSFPAASQVLLITYSAPEPAGAQEGAQAFADAYLQFRGDQASEEARHAVEFAQQQIAALQKQAREAQRQAAQARLGSEVQVVASNRAAQLNGQIAILESNVSFINLRSADPGEVLTPAGRPSGPASPNHANDAARGLLLGLVLGIGAALLRENVTSRPRTRAAR